MILIHLIEKIQKFNAQHGALAITPDKLRKSVITRYKQRALAESLGGIGINKKLIGELQQMNEYGNPD